MISVKWKLYGGLIVLGLVTVSVAVSASESSLKSALILENQTNQEMEYQQSGIGTKAQSGIDTKALTLPDWPACLSLPLPTTPKAPYYTFSGSWGSNDSVTFTVWREPCDASSFALMMRVVPSNEPFICSSSFNVIQSGNQYDSLKLTQTSGGDSFCHDLYVPTTFLMEQWSFKQNKFDISQAFTLIYDAVYDNYSVNVGAYTPPIGAPTLETDILVAIGEPAEASTYAGISNLRGWSISPVGINRVEYSIDGKAFDTVPYGGRRGDIGAAYPNYPSSDKSGYSMAFNYKNLEPGSHNITVRAYDNNGKYNETSKSFYTDRFNTAFISDNNAISVSDVSVNILDSNRLRLNGVQAEGDLWNVDLHWDRSSQSFAIEAIAPK